MHLLSGSCRIVRGLVKRANSTAATLKLTKDNGSLTLEQRKFYEDNGYLVIPKLVPNDMLEAYNKRFEDILAGRASRDNMTVMCDVKDRKSVNKIQDFNQDPVLKKHKDYKPIVDIAESICGPNILSVHTMFIAKPPDAGFGSSRQPAHQDLHYFPWRPAEWICGAWTAIEHSTKINGCLHLSPGSHKLKKILPHDYPKDTPVNKLFHGVQDMPSDMNPLIDIEMEPGDTIFFNSFLVHGSGVNRSKGTRKSISTHYVSADCHYIDIKGTHYEQLEAEMVGMEKGKNIKSISQYYDTKFTYVRGNRSNLRTESKG